MQVLITGASGYIGKKMCRYFSEKKGIGTIVGLDVKGPDMALKNVAFCKRDVREPLDDIIRKYSIDTVIHAAFVLPPIHDIRLMEDININGTCSVLDSCARTGVRRVLYLSSATAYGFHPDNDRPLSEESLLRGNEEITYSKSKRIIENCFREYREKNPGIDFIILRPCFVVGPGFDNPLARFLQHAIVPVPIRTEPMQFVHEDDLIDIIWILLQKGGGGIYNIAGDGVMTLHEMAWDLGNRTIRLPYPLLYMLNSMAWRLRWTFLSEFPSPYLNMIRYSWVVSNEKLKKAVGYRYRYNTREAFADFIRFAKSGKK